ncbi:MAG: hypothetical protein AABP62_28585 [Planctomycetota bacterium]
MTRLLTAAVVLGAVLSHTRDCRAQEPPKPPPPAFKMQPLNTLPGQPNSDRAPDGQVADGAAQPLNPPASASTSAVSQGNFAPNMIGDAFGLPFIVINDDRFSLPSPGGGVGTSKIAENTSPIPRDRVYLNYSYFDGVPLLANGVNVNRITPGIEKTFFGGMSSIEVRTPFASTLSNDLFIPNQNTPPNDTDSAEFGNLTAYLKQLLYTSDTLAVSVGLGLTLPTAGDTNVFLAPGLPPLVNIKNQSVHLLPFAGSLYTPTDKLFVQQFLQFDFDANGNAVRDGGFQPAGRLNDMTVLYYSVGAGYWLYNNPDSNRLFTRIAPIVELHYNKSLTNTDRLVTPNQIIINPVASNLDLLNGVVGLTAMMGENKSLTLAYTTPLGAGDNRQFNGELRLMFNWFFGGPTNRFSRVQF